MFSSNHRRITWQAHHRNNVFITILWVLDAILLVTAATLAVALGVTP
jgi:hypothetical protein